jgi:hypothetical protein
MKLKTLGRATGSLRTAWQTETAVFWAEITNRNGTTLHNK